jgi:double-strand break repair protein MRE11
VAIPVFSIHGNHDEPTGQEFYCALDVLQMTGLINYFGRAYENDKIDVKPVLLQKGKTKLALYGISNVRDERLFRVFRDKKIKFYQPEGSDDDWFNLMTVHQNHYSRSPTGYLPESFLPDFVDLVIWGHEHECLLKPQQSAEGNFYVSQPGSSIVTQLQRGEMGPKKIGLLTVTGKQFKMEEIRLKSPRPFLMKDIILAEQPELKNVWKKSDNRAILTKFIHREIDQMIEEAKEDWIEQQGDEFDESTKIPLPLLRLRVDYSAPDGGAFDLENSRRITNEYIQKVANHEEIILPHQKKKSRKATKVDMPAEPVVESITLDADQVDKYVQEVLSGQSLKILPRNAFGDAVKHFVERSDTRAIDIFATHSKDKQVEHMMSLQEFEETTMTEAMEACRVEFERVFAEAGSKTWQKAGVRKIRPRPSVWDSDMDGHWEDQIGAIIVDEDDGNNSDVMSIDQPAPSRKTVRGATKASATRKAPAAKAPVASKRGKKVVSDEEEEEEEESENGFEDDSQSLFVQTKKPAPKTTKSAAKGKAAAKATTAKQSTLDFSKPHATRPARAAASRKNPIVIDSNEEDEIEDSDDAFDDAVEMQPSRRARR